MEQCNHNRHHAKRAHFFYQTLYQRSADCGGPTKWLADCTVEVIQFLFHLSTINNNIGFRILNVSI